MKKLVVILTLVVSMNFIGEPQVRAGSVIGWGVMSYDSAQIAANDFVAIAAASGHGLALKTDGSIVGWGYNDSGQAKATICIEAKYSGINRLSFPRWEVVTWEIPARA